MKSPWTKKNPFLSMYLSGANAIAGAARGRATAAARRQAATVASQTIRQFAGLLDGSPPRPATGKKRRKTR